MRRIGTNKKQVSLSVTFCPVRRQTGCTKKAESDFPTFQQEIQTRKNGLELNARLTGGDDVKDAGQSLVSDLVGGVAQQSPVIEFGHRGVGDDAGRAAPGDVRRRDIDGIRGVVEGPAELHVRGVSVHLADDLGPFLLGHPVDPRLVRLATRCDCG